MASITFTDSKGKARTVEGAEGSTLMETAIKNNVPEIVAECGGACACATCHVYIDEPFMAKVGKAVRHGGGHARLRLRGEAEFEALLPDQDHGGARRALHVTTPDRQG